MREFQIGDKVEVTGTNWNGMDDPCYPVSGTIGEVIGLGEFNVYIKTDHPHRPTFAANIGWAFSVGAVKLVESTTPELKGIFPEDSAERKTYPMYTVLAGYFPSALAAVAHHSYENNAKHNPGEELHWSRGKSDDHLEAAIRHAFERDLEGLAWRALAALQLDLEAKGHPVPFAAR